MAQMRRSQTDSATNGGAIFPSKDPINSVTVDCLRIELGRFAENSLRDELYQLRHQIRSDFQQDFTELEEHIHKLLDQIEAKRQSPRPAQPSRTRSWGVDGRRISGEIKLNGQQANNTFPLTGGFRCCGSQSVPGDSLGHYAPLDLSPRCMLSLPRIPLTGRSLNSQGVGGLSSVKMFLDGSFRHLTLAMVALNIALLGFQVDYQAKWPGRLPIFFVIIDCIFCLFFTVEIALRICANGNEFFTGAESYMANWFDILLVAANIADTLIALVMNRISVLRIVRLFRLLRFVSLLSRASEARVLLATVASSIRMVMITLFFIFILTFAFSLVLMEIATSYRIHASRHGVEPDKRLNHFYGTFSRAIMRVYGQISSGTDCAFLLEPFGCPLGLTAVFLLYTSFMTFGLINLLISIFVSHHTRSAETDQVTELQQTLLAVFNAAGVDSCEEQMISKKIWEQQLFNPLLNGYLATMRLSPQEALECDLFELLDPRHTGEISPQHLVAGCMRLSGAARSVDLSVLAFNINKDMSDVETNFARVEDICGMLRR